MRHIEQDGYHAIEWPGGQGVSLPMLWHQYPEIVVGRYLVNTSFDSGHLTLSKSRRDDGWRMVAGLAHSPQILSTAQIPSDHYDEWLVFDRPVEVLQFETMVNFLLFSPVEYDWEEKREQFWEQVVRLSPLHVIAENDGAYMVSRDEKLVTKILESGVQ